MKTKKKSEGEIDAPGRLLNDFESTIQLEDEVYSIPTYVIYETRASYFIRKAFASSVRSGKSNFLNPENSRHISSELIAIVSWVTMKKLSRIYSLLKIKTSRTCFLC